MINAYEFTIFMLLDDHAFEELMDVFMMGDNHDHVDVVMEFLL